MEFQAVIFCGRGKQLTPFSKTRSSGLPKALLPVVNKPMLQHVVEWCDKAPFKELIIVTDSASFEDISQMVKSYQEKRNPEIAASSSITCLAVDCEATGDVISHIKERLTSNFVLLPCDFITDLPPQVLIEAYRNKQDSELGMAVSYRSSFENVDKKQVKTDYTIYSQTEGGHLQLLDVYSKNAVELAKAIQIRTQMCWRFPFSNVSTSLLDAFIYFCDKRVLDIADEELSSGPHVCSKKIMRDLARRSWRHSSQRETVGLFILPDECVFARANNLSVYMEVHRWLMKLKAKNTSSQPVQPKEKGAATIGADSLVGLGSTVDERTSVKHTVIGENCKVGKKCRLTGCLLLDDIVIQDDVHMENCIIGKGVVLESKSRLVNCHVENSHTVSKGTQAKGETLLDFSLEGILEESVVEDDFDVSEESSDFSDISGEDVFDDEEYDEIDDGLFDRS